MVGNSTPEFYFQGILYLFILKLENSTQHCYFVSIIIYTYGVLFSSISEHAPIGILKNPIEHAWSVVHCGTHGTPLWHPVYTPWHPSGTPVYPAAPSSVRAWSPWATVLENPF